MKNFLFTMMLLIPTIALVGCGNDNEPKSVEGGTVIEIDGTRISSIGNYSIEYDDEGRPCSISSRYSGFTIDYKNGVITPSDYDDEFENSYDVKFKDGYISNISMSWNYKGEDYEEKGNSQAEFKYSNGYLMQVKIVSEGEVDYDDGTTEKNKESVEIKLTWENGNMLSAVVSGYDSSSGSDSGFDSWTESYTYSYGDVTNEFNQFPICVSECWAGDSLWGILTALGLFGKGTSTMPIGYTFAYDDEYSREYSSINISLNSNGSISKEAYGSTTLKYSYADFTRVGETESNVIFQPLYKIFRNHKKFSHD